MTDAVRTTEAAAPPDGSRLPRLFAETGGASLAAHQAHYGALPVGGPNLIADVEAAGLRGRGGAGFPTAVKLATVAGGRGRAVVVVNGTEGEPASNKDKTLLTLAPHLVLDGATLAAEAVGARRILLCIERTRPDVAAVVTQAVAERSGAGVDRVEVSVELAPDRYVAGEESALVHWLNGGDAKPLFVPPRPFEKGVGGRPTLVDNAETLAHLGLIGRFGPAWFRAAGTEEDPGSTLLTISGGVGQPGVYEVASGSSLATVLSGAGAVLGPSSAVLIGGYFGTWVAGKALDGLTIGSASLRRAGSSLGCGVIFVLPEHACGLHESARVARWLAGENAGQCGPCVHGLDALAGAMEAMVLGGWESGVAAGRVPVLAQQIVGRGACKHPDGAVRFVQSSLRVFASEIALHAHSGPCGAKIGYLPTPRPGGWR